MEPIIKVDNVSMCFNLSKEKHESLKEYFLAMVHRVDRVAECHKTARNWTEKACHRYHNRRERHQHKRNQGRWRHVLKWRNLPD